MAKHVTWVGNYSDYYERNNKLLNKTRIDKSFVGNGKRIYISDPSSLASEREVA